MGPASATRGAALLLLLLLRHILARVIAGVGFLHRQGQRIALVIRLLFNFFWLERRAESGLLAIFSACGRRVVGAERVREEGLEE